MYVDGANVGEGRIELTEPIGFGAVYTDVGRAALSPVTDDYAPGEADFTGTIKWVQLESGDDSYPRVEGAVDAVAEDPHEDERDPGPETKRRRTAQHMRRDPPPRRAMSQPASQTQTGGSVRAAR